MKTFHLPCLPRCLLRRENYRRRPFNLLSSWSHGRRTHRSNHTTKPLEIGNMQIQLPIREGGEEDPPCDVATANLETMPLFTPDGGIRRRSASDSSVSGHIMSPRRSFGREVQHAAEETFLLTRLTLTLLRYLG